MVDRSARACDGQDRKTVSLVVSQSSEDRERMHSRCGLQRAPPRRSAPSQNAAPSDAVICGKDIIDRFVLVDEAWRCPELTWHSFRRRFYQHSP